jgi:hypothetical protein
MSMELYVFSDTQLASIDAWQQAIDADGIPLQLLTPFTFQELRGALPARFRDKATAFECDHWNAIERITESPDVVFGRRWRYALAFRWGSNVYDGIGAHLAGSAYARATDGVLLDCEEGKIISPQRAAEIAWDIEKSIPMIEAAVRKAVERFRK